MTAVLPATYTVRPPTKDDAKAVFDLVAAYNTAVIGVADYTVDDMVDELTDPGFAPETDGWLVFDGDRLRLGLRGRGLAKFLLRDQFALDAAAGRTGTILHVDTNNPTPALDLYLSVGMTATLVIDAWQLRVDA